MPHASFKVIPGVDTTKTPALNEAAISESQLVRFMPDRTLGGLVQKLGGWTKYVQAKAGSIVRNLWAWEDTNANSYLAIGAEGKEPIVVTGASGNGTKATLTYTGPFTFVPGYHIVVSGMNPSAYNGTYAVTNSTNSSVSFSSATTSAFVSGGTIEGGGGSLTVATNGGITDITPQALTGNVAVSFTTVTGSNAVKITLAGSNAQNIDAFDIQTQVSVGGIVLFGLYQCYENSTNDFYIYAFDYAGDPNLATPTSVTGASGNGTTVTLTYTGPFSFTVGNSITVSGMNPSAYNGTYTVTNSTNSSVSFSSATTSAFVSGGTIEGGGTGGAVPSYTTIADNSSVTVTLNNHTYGVGDTFAALVATAVGGVTIYGNYTILTVPTANTFTIQASILATSAATVSENSGLLHYVFYRGIGSTYGSGGYGAGEYGLGGYGTGTTATNASITGTPINAVDWCLDNWGQVLIANPLNGPIYQWNPSSGSILANVIANAPPVNAGCFVAMPQRQIVTWGSTSTGIGDPLLIRWCDVNNYNDWIPTLVNQAGSYRIPKGSKIVQCIQGPQQGLVWTDLGLWAMQYAGPPYVYQFNELGNGCGLIGRRAAGSVNGVVYWMGPSQFYRLAGSGVEPIQCPVWDVAFQDLDTTQVDKIRVAPNSRFGEISWYYPTAGNNGEVSHYVKYNFILNQWDYGTLGRTAWINESVLGPPMGADPVTTYIYQHETSPDADGQPMTSYFQTGYFALTEANVKMFVDQVWPDMKWGYYGGTQSANVLLTFYVTDYAGQTPTAYGPYTLTQATTYITPRFRGRLVSIRVESNDIGSWWRIGNTRYRVQEDGKY